ncbi:MAG: hypothetical protein IKW11_03025 [Bacteroidales bacterium]|nr:hypothetical protein [Bacteroidales bacterium]
MRTKLIPIKTIILMAAGLFSCQKPDHPNNGQQEATSATVEAEQFKYYMTAQEDLEGKVNEATAGMKVILMDSKYYAVRERVLEVTFEADNVIAGKLEDGKVTNTSNSITMKWASDDPINRPAVGREGSAGEYGILCLPGSYSGTFTVKTNRYTYQFTQSVELKKGEITSIQLDFSKPLVQPKRKVGVMGDSISTFDGTMCNPDYSPYYPGNDPNVTANPSIAVNSKEKTYWWRLIYDYMKNGELDVNTSWSGTRVIHEVKTGRQSGKSIGAGFVDRAYDFVDPDIIIIHGGTNDRNQSTPVGEYTWDLPIGQGNLGNYRSAYIELIKMLQNRYEGVQIIIIVGDRLTLDYERATVAIAEHFGLPYVNFVGVTIDKCSGSHPTAPAFDKMASMIYEQCIDYLP